MTRSSAKRLYFLRHGLADRSAWNGSDYERPLTPTGRDRMIHEAKSMANLNLSLELILTSPLARAYQTAEIVAEQLDLIEHLQVEERLGLGFGSADLAATLAENSSAEHIMLVGHEPDFSLTISEITGGGDIVCKKGSLARIDLFSSEPPAGQLVWLIPPKVLAG